MVEIQPILNTIGETVSSITKQILDYLTEKGLINAPTTAKLITILIILLVTWAVLHFVHSLKMPIKILIYIVSILLIISIGSTFMI